MSYGRQIGGPQSTAMGVQRASNRAQASRWGQRQPSGLPRPEQPAGVSSRSRRLQPSEGEQPRVDSVHG